MNLPVAVETHLAEQKSKGMPSKEARRGIELVVHEIGVFGLKTRVENFLDNEVE
jgi:hypothetical protein